MKLCITEKPSVAKDIASILGASKRCDGYYEGPGYRVTWTFGHLCTLKEPADYTELWKRWSLGSLPMIPPRFGIKVIADKGIEKQFNIIKTLIGEADEVINCGDAGQEGELIQRWVMQKADTHCPVKRLWISSLTDESIKEGFKTLKPQEDYDSLYYAGLSRAIGDWILGMNATRLYSLKYSSPGNVLSIGRVQTPTLALIVQRHHEIANFKPEDYWELKTLYRNVTFNATSGRFSTEEDASAALDLIKGKPMVINDVSEKKGREAPPRLFDLTSLQVECNKKWGWTADDTLRLIQSLYEKKVTTYPRVDTTYLSDDIYPKVPVILKQMTPYAQLTATLLSGKLPKSKKVFDNSKVTDHHAIIPTGQSPAALVGDERKMYHLIALRFIGAFYPDCVFQSTTVLGEVDKVGFKASGKVIVEPGWRSIYADKDSSDENSEDGILPPFTVGESGPHEPSLLKKQTQPPKLYTEGTLLRAMESAGKTVDDEELREAMKENGIGRPSTRAAIIETLFKRKYIYRDKKNIRASQAGIDLIAIINEELLKSAKLTGLWENKLRRIERGEFSAGEFISELKELMGAIVINVLSDNSARHIQVEQKAEAQSKSAKDEKVKKPRAPRVRKLEDVKCPVCGKGHLLKGKAAYGCSCFRDGCSFRVDFTECGSELTPAKVANFIKKKYGG
ncbi:MAG: DNA topoisomerase 3 [Bacteroides sp.]|nr:DNA topoisomerase 3 [Bacteroides sp.]MCM1391059.1 DNA topoisomerase 3 [Bacteroides sp.]